METVDRIYRKDLWNMEDSIDRFKDRFDMEEFHPSFDGIFTWDSFPGCFKEFLLHFKLFFMSVLKSSKYQLVKGQLKNSVTSKLEQLETIAANGFNLLLPQKICDGSDGTINVT